MNGILLIDKPSGWTSFDVVAKIRGMIRRETGLKKLKVGHAGTLDPLATGLLVILLGTYCKRAGEFSKLDKTYQVTMKLGQTSTTGDEEGEKTAVSGLRPPKSAVLAALKRFEGEIMQTPHKYSAIKVDGQRAYKLARAGKEVVLEPRRVTIYDITDVTYHYPKVKFTTKVSSGTYIRSLVEDIGKELHTGAYMAVLRRTSIGPFGIGQALNITALDDWQTKDHILLA
ncbi:MAG TPA: tRNA pseudouridine(55) synthase TruB [Candidatus Saccharimonadales bacterium]|nr:tRNA pseudouridine(55) synthase TruB [Candidatus Saccharimonadales bacterium]